MGRAVDELAVPDPWAHPHRLLSAAWAVVLFGLVAFWTVVGLVLWLLT